MDVITFAGVRGFSVFQRLPTVWATSEIRPRNLYPGRATTCQLTRGSHGGRRRKVCARPNFFAALRVRTSQNVHQTCTTFTSRERIVHWSCQACNKILPRDINTTRPGVTAASDCSLVPALGGISYRHRASNSECWDCGTAQPRLDRDIGKIQQRQQGPVSI